ncbi:hypothetical protein Tco_0533756 [Tanacetum coccineum]
MEEYLAIENEWMAKQRVNSFSKKLWYLTKEDEEEESYVLDMNEFPAIQIRKNLSSNSTATKESLYSILDEKYDAIACEFLPNLELLLASDSQIVDPVCSIGTFEEKFKGGADVIKDDLFTYELGVVEDFYFPCDNGNLDVYEPRKCYDEYERMFVEVVILIGDRLVRLIDITLEQWLDLKFGDHKGVDKKVMEEVIKRRLDTYVEHDPTNIDFVEWLPSKFSKHIMMDRYTKNALWIYWKRGDDEEVLTDNELSNPEEKNEEDEIAEIFRIETDLF